MDADVPDTMLAWRLTRFGGVEVLCQQNVPVPEPGRGEVLVEVQAAALNPVDLKTLQGRYPLVSHDDLPFTPGRDVAGSIPLAALTAWQGLFDHGKRQSGERVLMMEYDVRAQRLADNFPQALGHPAVLAKTAPLQSGSAKGHRSAP